MNTEIDSLIGRLRNLQREVNELDQDLDPAALNEFRVQSNTYNEIIKYISTAFSSIGVAYISIGVIQQVFEPPQNFWQAVFSATTDPGLVTLLYSFIIGSFIILVGMNTLRFLE